MDSNATSAAEGSTAGDPPAGTPSAVPDPGWTWPPAGPADVDTAHFATEQWAPPSTVRHPLLRLGRWTLLYRRAAPRRATRRATRRAGPSRSGRRRAGARALVRFAAGLVAHLLAQLTAHLPLHLPRRGSGRAAGRR